MSQPHLRAVAKLVRDLFSYDHQNFEIDPVLAAKYQALIKFDREGTQQDDLKTSYIVVNGSSVSTKQSSGKSYDGEAEIMNYNDQFQQAVILEFYGDDAYTNASKFSALSVSQVASDLKRTLGLSISRVSTATDVKQVLGSAYGNRVHVEMNVNYNPSFDVETLRIDTAEFEISEDK